MEMWGRRKKSPTEWVPKSLDEVHVGSVTVDILSGVAASARVEVEPTIDHGRTRGLALIGFEPIPI